MVYNDQLHNSGSYVQQTPNFDVARFYEVEVGSDEFKELLVLMYQQINDIAIVLNAKVSGLNITDEFATSKVWFPKVGYNPNDYRPSFHISVVFGPLPNTGSKSVSHTLNLPTPSTYTLIGIDAVASNNTINDFRSIPYVDVTNSGADNIQIVINATSVVITVGGSPTVTYSNWNAVITFEYLKI